MGIEAYLDAMATATAADFEGEKPFENNGVTPVTSDKREKVTEFPLRINDVTPVTLVTPVCVEVQSAENLSAAALAAQMQQAGVSLWLEAGRLRYGGNRETVGQWLPVISEHRAALIEALAALPPPADPEPSAPCPAPRSTAPAFRSWQVSFADGSTRDVFTSPPCDLTEMQATYPDAKSITANQKDMKND